MTLSIFLVFAALEMLSLATMPSVLLRRRGNPVSATGWLVALVALPGLSWLLWIVFGRTRLERRTRRQLRSRARRHSVAFNRSKTCFEDYVPARAYRDDGFCSSDNQVELLKDGHRAFPRLEDALRGAQCHIHVFFFCFEMDDTGERLLSILKERSAAQVVVRLLVDGLGSQSSYKELTRRLEGSNVRLEVFLPKKLRPLHLPRLNFVNHRKIVVIDEAVAFTGGMNVGDDYARNWRDLMVRLEGPAAYFLNHVFLEDWYFACEELLPTPAPPGPAASRSGTDVAVFASGPSTEAWIQDAYFASIVRARRRVWLTTPYLIPTVPLQHALRYAAGRGVDVRIVLPRTSDVRIASWAGRPYYRALIRDGVRIFEYDKMVHAKAIVADDLAGVGSANLDYRSMHLSFEILCLVDDPRTAEELAVWMEELREQSKEVTLEILDGCSRRERLLESAAHLLSPLL